LPSFDEDGAEDKDYDTTVNKAEDNQQGTSEECAPGKS
jgi:hypothetical protein